MEKVCYECYESEIKNMRRVEGCTIFNFYVEIFFDDENDRSFLRAYNKTEDEENLFLLDDKEDFDYRANFYSLYDLFMVAKRKLEAEEFYSSEFNYPFFN